MKTYSMDCEDGFKVMSGDKEEVMKHAMVHMKDKHSDMKVSHADMEKKIMSH